MNDPEPLGTQEGFSCFLFSLGTLGVLRTHSKVPCAIIPALPCSSRVARWAGRLEGGIACSWAAQRGA